MDQEELEAAQKFELDNPELVCRWRLSGGVLPLDNRHLRALSKRVVAQKEVGLSSILRERLKKGHKSFQMAFL